MRKKPKKPIIIWSEVWDDFETWCQDWPRDRCNSCGHTKNYDPNWEDQQVKIEEIVERHLSK